MVAYKDMVAHGLNPTVYLGCLERVMEGCFALGTAESVQSGYWEILKALVNGAKRARSPPSGLIIFGLCGIPSKLTSLNPRTRG